MNSLIAKLVRFKELWDRDAPMAEVLPSIATAHADQYAWQRACCAHRGRAIHEVIRNTDLHRFATVALESASPVEGEIRLQGEGERILQAHGAALRDRDDRQVGAVIAFNDVTRIRRLENVRRDFVANVSHELRTPITAIKGFVETIRDDAPRHPDDTFPGRCPFHGDCLEGLASGPAIADRWGVSAEELGESTPRAVEIAAFSLGYAMANLVLALSPQRIILGGGADQRALARHHCPARGDRRRSLLGRRAAEVGGGKDVADVSLALLDVEPAVVRDDPGRILSTVLDGEQSLVDLVYGGIRADDSDEPAHQRSPPRKMA